MSQEIQKNSDGNTKPSSSPPSNYQAYRWCGTTKAEKANVEEFWKLLNEHSKEFYFQKEKGASGYEHYQWCLSLKHKEYFNTMRNIIGLDSHIEGVFDWIACKKYCTKEDTRIEGPWDKNSTFIQVVSNLLPWQEALRDELLKPIEYFSRKIIWYYDNGNTGKSEFVRYMCVRHKAYVFSNAKTADIAFAIKEDPKIILFDLPRSAEDRFNYSVIEQLKNGIIFSSKYESNTKVFNKPHIVIFANFKPDEDEMTHDRWEIREIQI